MRLPADTHILKVDPGTNGLNMVDVDSFFLTFNVRRGVLITYKAYQSLNESGKFSLPVSRRWQVNKGNGQLEVNNCL
jgi:hypothetical protein